MTLTYEQEFYAMMLLRLAKRHCPHCHETGIAGRRVGSGHIVACQCAVQNIVKYQRLKKPRVEKIVRLSPEVRKSIRGGRYAGMR